MLNICSILWYFQYINNDQIRFQIGIPALGFSPMMYTQILLHDHNEYLNENTFLNGINVYYNIIKGLASE